MNRVNKIEISHRTIIFTVIFLIGLWLLLQIRDILFLLFISFILMSALRPLVDRLESWRIPRVVAILFWYIILFGVFGVFLAGTIPSLVVQSVRFIQELPSFITRVMPYWNIDVSALSQQIAPLGENLLRVTVGIFSNIVTTLTVLVFTFYFLLERRHTETFLHDTLGESAAKRVFDAFKLVERRLSAWVQGQLLLMVLIGVMVYVGLTILHIEFALPLAIIAGVLEIVPVIGPILSAVPAVLVALSINPLLALSVVALYFIVQQIENNFLVPLVMKKSVGLSPLITIFALLIGGRLAGIAGAVLAVPVLLVLQTVFSEYLSHTETI